MNNTSPETLSYITLCIYVCPYIYLYDYSRGIAGHMRPVTSAVGPASAQCCWLCHLSSDGLVESHRAAPFTENIPVFRGEYIKMSTISYCYISFVRLQSHILPCSFGGTPRCFDVLKSHDCQDVRQRVAHACGSRCTRSYKHRAPLWFTEHIRLPMWILAIAMSIIDLNVHRWSTTKLM